MTTRHSCDTLAMQAYHMNDVFKDTQALSHNWENFLRALTSRLSKPSSSLPTVRCLTRKTLVGIFRDVERELSLPSTFPSGIKILKHLISMGLARRIPLEWTDIPAPSKEFYSMGFQGSQEPEIDSLELLQAFNKKGIICYFSALSHLELTTQVAVHHHVAIPIRKRVDENIARPLEKAPNLDQLGETSKRSKFGTHIFSYEGIPYYSTKRAMHSIPGIQERILSPWATIRMSSMEQTLLDTLQYPYHCGGPEVVFEAWQSARDRYREEKLLECLKKIDLPPLIRRLGALYNLFDYTPSKPLGQFLEEKRMQFFTQSENSTIPLLRGSSFSQVDPQWNVLVP